MLLYGYAVITRRKIGEICVCCGLIGDQSKKTLRTWCRVLANESKLFDQWASIAWESEGCYGFFPPFLF